MQQQTIMTQFPNHASVEHQSPVLGLNHTVKTKNASARKQHSHLFKATILHKEPVQNPIKNAPTKEFVGDDPISYVFH